MVGVDFSESSRAALVEADYIALWEGGELHVVHVITIDQPYLIPKITAAEELIFSGMRGKLKIFTEQTTNLCMDRTYHVCAGNPFERMMGLVGSTGADLLVLGSHGAGGKPNHVGAIASRCIRHAGVPVLLVRRQHDVG